mmetsp:Transcript_83132/g.164952  ORF Transcript_83132/g.164952 Transcript_83132/m.164952 type:complete len:337 (+) Transcript_83132:108-1118(+)
MGNSSGSAVLPSNNKQSWWRCCVPSRSLSGQGDEEDARGPATNHIQLAASELFNIPGLATAYHTSVLVNGEEFFFSDSGILWDRALTSHQGKPSELVDVGFSPYTGVQLLNSLQPHFMPGSYDLIRKNCNSFSDVALYFLLRKRLDKKYSALERLGQRASPDMLQRFTKGMYVPNHVASSFCSDKVIQEVNQHPVPSSQRLIDSVGSLQGAQSRAALTIGARVTVVGLKNAEQYNGQGAVIHRYNGVNGRWEAMLNLSGEVKAFRSENLRPAGELVLQTGDRVRIHGLVSETGQVMNGKEGEVIGYLHDVSRYEVRVEDATKAFKPENLQVLKVPA